MRDGRMKLMTIPVKGKIDKDASHVIKFEEFDKW